MNSPDHSYQGGNRFGGTDETDYEERTLSIQVFDNRTKELIWMGWSKRNATSDVEVENVKAAIANILAKFPATSSAAQAK